MWRNVLEKDMGQNNKLNTCIWNMTYMFNEKKYYRERCVKHRIFTKHTLIILHEMFIHFTATPIHVNIHQFVDLLNLDLLKISAHSLLAKLGQWQWLRMMRLAWKKRHLKRLHWNETRRTGCVKQNKHNGFDSQFMPLFGTFYWS